jgi:hypothetical protein
MRVATLLALSLLAGAARAGDPSAGDKETARGLMASGMSKYQAGDYQGALSDFEAADLIMAVPTTRTAVGKAQEKLGRLLEARDTLIGVARMPKDPKESEPFEQARREAAALEQDLARRIPALKLAVSGPPQGTAVTASIDGTAIPQALVAVERKLNPGTHRVKVSAPGFEPVEITVELAEGEQKTLPVALKPAGAGGAPQPQPTDGDSQGGISPVAWVGFAIGGAGIIAGAVTGGLAMSKTSELEEACPDKECSGADGDELDSATALAHASTACFAVGGAGLALGLIGLFALSPTGGDDEAAVVPMVGPGGIAVRGRF